MIKDIEPENINGYLHGYQEWYYDNGSLRYRGLFKNGLEMGYEEWEYTKTTNFYIR